MYFLANVVVFISKQCWAKGGRYGNGDQVEKRVVKHGRIVCLKNGKIILMLGKGWETIRLKEGKVS